MRFLFPILFLFLFNATLAQNSIGINNTTPHASAILDIQSNSKGLLPPRMTTLERNAITSPSNGLMIFNTDTKCLEIRSGSSWIMLCEGACIPNPSTSNAGLDITSPSALYTLQGNTPTIGTGAWSIIAGSGGSIADVNNPNSNFLGVMGNTYILRWTISNACGNNFDDVTIVIGCAPGFANCNGISVDGCEMNIATNINNCGACGNVCASYPNATRGCSGGICFLASCNIGYANCNGANIDGCEVSIQSDINNCGSCGTVCPNYPNATKGCSGGVCFLASCNSGFANCNGIAADGCEVNLMANPNNCGACGNVCPLGQSCIGGTCQ